MRAVAGRGSRTRPSSSRRLTGGRGAILEHGQQIAHVHRRPPVVRALVEHAGERLAPLGERPARARIPPPDGTPAWTQAHGTVA
ncbi:hypothetical protein [Sorangium sp. So ce861]|uniref:hypothetical protein n=1 Tax=Sorangium sp. So ce861 TaxID=3133323 RepID=UPI003F5EF837